ncbi:MAG: YIP1 family protein [Holophagales bacterium]|nr:YIP1 family protein [Holophagales bacterium]
MTDQPVVPEANAGNSSDLDHLIGAITSPTRTFESIARKPTWLLPLVLLALLGAAAVWSLYSKVDASEFLSYLEARGQSLPASVSGEQVLGWTRVSSIVGAAIFGPVTYLVVAGLFLMLFRMGGGTLDFKRSLSVTVHGFLPFGIAAMVGMALATFRETISMREIESGGLVPSNLAVFLGDDASGVVRAIASSVDLFSVWCIVLLAIGYSIVAKVHRGKAYGFVGLVWGVGILVKVALSALR